MIVQRSSLITAVSSCPVLIDKKSENASHTRVHTARSHHGSSEIEKLQGPNTPLVVNQRILLHTKGETQCRTPSWVSKIPLDNEVACSIYHADCLECNGMFL